MAKQPADAATISKAEAIRRAIAGGYVQPDDGIAFIKSTFGLDVTKAHFSADKSKLKSKGGVTVKVKRGRKPLIKGLLAPPPKAARDGEGSLLAAMEAMKPLVAALGVDRVKRLAELLG